MLTVRSILDRGHSSTLRTPARCPSHTSTRARGCTTSARQGWRQRWVVVVVLAVLAGAGWCLLAGWPLAGTESASASASASTTPLEGSI